MAYKNFNKYKYVQVPITGNTYLGGFKTSRDGLLKNIRTEVYFRGLFQGAEQLRLNVYTDSNLQNIYASSSWINLYEVLDENGNQSTGNWLGYVKTTFSGQHINSNFTYYIDAQTSGYSLDILNRELSFCYDYPFHRYANASSTNINQANITFEVFLDELPND